MEVLIWDKPSADGWYWYLFILFFLIFVASLISNALTRKNKIIFCTISLVLLLSLPIGRRLVIQNFVSSNGYSLIVDKGFVWPQYREVVAERYLWCHLFYCVSINNESKLVYIGQGKTALEPQTVGEIEFISPK